MSHRHIRGRAASGGSAAAIIGFVVMLVAVWIGAGKLGLFGGSGGGPSVAAASTNGDAAAILAEAEKHDNEGYVYGGGHPPGSYRDGSGLDCSGLVDVAVLQATGVNENNTAAGFQGSSHWTSIPISDVRTGDIVYLLKVNHPGHSDDHVAIVISNNNPHLTVFEAYSWHVPFGDQIRQSSNYTYGDWDGALRFHR